MARKKTADRGLEFLEEKYGPVLRDEEQPRVVRRPTPRRVKAAPLTDAPRPIDASRVTRGAKPKPEHKERTQEAGDVPSLDLSGPAIERPKLSGLDALRQGEEECEALHRAAVERFKHLLRDLEGFEGTSKQERQVVAKQVNKLAHRLGLVLMAYDQPGELVPVTLRCRGQKYEARRSDGNQVGSFDPFPALQVVSKEELTSCSTTQLVSPNQ